MAGKLKGIAVSTHPLTPAGLKKTGESSNLLGHSVYSNKLDAHTKQRAENVRGNPHPICH